MNSNVAVHQPPAPAAWLVPGAEVGLRGQPSSRATVICLGTDGRQAFIRVWRSPTSAFAEWIPVARLRAGRAGTGAETKGGLAR